MVIDMTAQRRVELSLRHSEEQLRQAQKMEAMGRLAGGVAHDFNNLLSVILGYTDILSEQVAVDPALVADVHEIRKASLRAAALTRQLLMFSRHDVIEARVLDVQSDLNEMSTMLPRLLGDDILLVTALAPDTGHIRTEPGQLEQVVMNLAVNARDAMPRGGRLTLASEQVELAEEYARETFGTRAGPYVVISVTDTGSGIDRATQARIFEPFFTTKEIGKGTGLGLSIVFGIAKRSGGGVCVVSEVGVGSTFKVYFPRVTDRVEAVEKLPVAKNLRGTETILLVEDEDEVRATARIILHRSGYRVIEASTALNALLLCEDAGHIDMLLSDVVMPQMSGPALAQQLIKSRPATKILYMSGHTDDNIARHEVLDGDIAFLQKPFTADSLRRKVRLVLDAP